MRYTSFGMAMRVTVLLSLGAILYSIYVSLKYVSENVPVHIVKSWSVNMALPSNISTSNVCSNISGQRTWKSQGNRTDKRIVVNVAHNIGYCDVPKAGSSFWYGVFAHLTSNVSNNILERIENIQQKYPQQHYHTLKTKDRLNLISNGYIFMFARNPYERLLSTYVDKFLRPNSLYWSSFGKGIVETVRSKPSQKSKECGQDVTFAEFLQYVTVNSGADHHWTPIYRLCDPCHYPYKYIGKVESFEKDAMVITKQTNITIDFDSSDVTATIKYINIRIIRFVDHYNRLKKCVDFTDVIRRLWDYLKSKGLIMYEAVPPKLQIEMFGEDQKALVTEIQGHTFADFLDMAKSGGISTGVAEQYFAEAYNKVPTVILQKIKKIYLPDFLLFGYDPEPRLLFADRTASPKHITS